MKYPTVKEMIDLLQTLPPEAIFTFANYSGEAVIYVWPSKPHEDDPVLILGEWEYGDE